MKIVINPKTKTIQLDGQGNKYIQIQRQDAPAFEIQNPPDSGWEVEFENFVVFGTTLGAPPSFRVRIRQAWRVLLGRSKVIW